jgi:hypothetical protein
MQELRTALVDAEIALRGAQDGERTARLLAERDAIVAVGGVKGLGSNEAERDRNLALALLAHPFYQQTLAALRQAQQDRDLAAAALESSCDARRERELSVRERIATLLESGRATPELLLS